MPKVLKFLLFSCVFGLFAIPYGYWLLHSYELGLRFSQPMETAIKAAYFTTKEEYPGEDTQNPYKTTLAAQIMEHGRGAYFREHDISFNLLSNLVGARAPQIVHCKFWWFPLHKCVGVQTTETLIKIPKIRAIFETAIRNPCRYLRPELQQRSFEIEAARKAFECHRNSDGNPFTVGLALGYGTHRAEDITWYEATR